MQVVSPESCPRPSNGTAVTIGFFDGVHLGHQLVISEVRRLAAERGAASAVVTFDRHPAAVVRPKSAPLLITDLDQRLDLLAATGLDYALVLPFDAERSNEAAEGFVRSVLVGCLGAKAVIVGDDFHFGRGRSGGIETLRALGADLGFEVDGIELSASGVVGTQPISSTAIRRALVEGDLDAVRRMLGRDHEVRGVVVTGDRRGRELGFPTANVAVDASVCLPADGIYAGWFERADGAVHRAALSLGVRPTFYADAPERLLEANLLDFAGDLYGESVRVRFARRLRGEAAFGSVDELVAQMQRDVADTRRLLA